MKEQIKAIQKVQNDVTEQLNNLPEIGNRNGEETEKFENLMGILIGLDEAMFFLKEATCT